MVNGKLLIVAFVILSKTKDLGNYKDSSVATLSQNDKLRVLDPG
jgi:hypothetical protein